jgi:ABC-type phosphate transport system substrate-binding protein
LSEWRRGSLEIPFATSKLAVAHSIPNSSTNGTIALDADTLADIYSCRIGTWDHPDIAALNPNITCVY